MPPRLAEQPAPGPGQGPQGFHPFLWMLSIFSWTISQMRTPRPGEATELGGCAGSRHAAPACLAARSSVGACHREAPFSAAMMTPEPRRSLSLPLTCANAPSRGRLSPGLDHLTLPSVHAQRARPSGLSFESCWKEAAAASPVGRRRLRVRRQGGERPSVEPAPWRPSPCSVTSGNLLHLSGLGRCPIWRER